MANSFRLNPNAAMGGDTLSLEVHGIGNPSHYQGKVCEVHILEVDLGQDKGRPASKNDLLATFQAEVINSGTTTVPKFSFDKVTRTDTFPAAIPPEVPRFSHEGHPLTFSPGFKPPQFKICFATKAGKSSDFLVLLKGDPGERENYVYEIAFKVMVAGKVLFNSSAMPTALNCKNMLAHNCVRAAEMLVADHFEMISTRGVGLYYGSKCTDSTLTLDKTRFKLKSTSCIDFQLQATELGHQNTLANSDWNRIKGFMKEGKGTLLFKGFEDAGWIGLYYNPDVVNPFDGFEEHPYSYQVARRRSRYYDLKVRSFIINYRPTTVFEDGSAPKTVTPQDSSQISNLNTVPFGVLIARGGDHTAVIMSGAVHEVHWLKDARDPNLYESSDFETEWPWLSGLIMVPPGSWT